MSLALTFKKLGAVSVRRLGPWRGAPLLNARRERYISGDASIVAWRRSFGSARAGRSLGEVAVVSEKGEATVDEVKPAAEEEAHAAMPAAVVAAAAAADDDDDDDDHDDDDDVAEAVKVTLVESELRV